MEAYRQGRVKEMGIMRFQKIDTGFCELWVAGINPELDIDPENSLPRLREIMREIFGAHRCLPAPEMWELSGYAYWPDRSIGWNKFMSRVFNAYTQKALADWAK